MRQVIAWGMCVHFGAVSASLAAEKPVLDLLLVIAVDVSLSVTDDLNGKHNPNELALQRRGVAEALRSPEVAQRLSQCNSDGIAVTYAEWAGDGYVQQFVQVVPWRKVSEPQDLEPIAQQIEALTERPFSGYTDLARALDESMYLLGTAPYQSERKVISLSADGRQNILPDRDLALQIGEDEGPYIAHLRAARDRAVSEGAIIDALLILNDADETQFSVGLPDYVESHLIGGPGAFLHFVRDYHEYAEGLVHVLVRELNNCRI